MFGKMNLLGWQPSNEEVAVPQEEKRQSLRAFGRDLTNTLGGQAVAKPGSKHKRTASDLLAKEPLKPQPPLKPPTEAASLLSQYQRDHFETLCREDDQLSFTGLLGITMKMRSILVDWLVDVHSSFNLSQRTLHLAYKYLDSYLSQKKASREDLQLIGITCLWMASKYEEIYPPRVRVFVDVTANTYSHDQLLDMELRVLTALNFQLVKPTAYNFVDMLGLQPKNRSLSLYAIEAATIEGSPFKYRQAVIAAAAINLADSVLKTQTALKDLNHLVPASEMACCFKELCSILSQPSKYGLTALSRKYGQPEWHSASKLKLTSNKDH